MHKATPFIGTREVARRASVFQTKQSGFLHKKKMDSKSRKSTGTKGFIRQWRADSQTGLNAHEQEEHPFISQSKGDSTSRKIWLYMIVYTDSRNKAEPKGETLRTFKTCYEYNRDFGKGGG